MNHRAVLALQERRGSLHTPPPTGANAHTTMQRVSGSLLISVAHYVFWNRLHLASHRIISDLCTIADGGHVRHPHCGDVHHYAPPLSNNIADF